MPIVALPIPQGCDDSPTLPGSSTEEADSHVRLKVIHESLESRLSIEPLDRPLTRADCQPGGEHYHRPCPYVSCIHNLFIEVDEDTGDIVGDPDADPWEQDPDRSCTLDIVDEHPNGIVIEEISDVLQAKIDEMIETEERLLTKLREQRGEDSFENYEDMPLNGEGGTTILGELCTQFQGGVEKGLADHEDDRSGRVLPDRFNIFEPPQPRRGATRLFTRFGSDPVVPEAEYLRAFWKVYERSSRSRQEEIAAGLDQTWAMFVGLLLGIAEAQLSRPRRKRVNSKR